MASSYADSAAFLARVPAAFANLDADAIAVALEDAQEFVGLSLYKGKALLAHVYVTAHLLVCRFPTELGSDGGGDTPGPVSSMSAEAISASFAVAPPSSEDSFGSTKWGRKFLEVSRFVPHTLLAV